MDPARFDQLQAEGQLGAEEAEEIRLNGYIATHLENIERNEGYKGYKGFNKPGIDCVLRALAPRASVRETAPVPQGAQSSRRRRAPDVGLSARPDPAQS